MNAPHSDRLQRAPVVDLDESTQFSLDLMIIEQLDHLPVVSGDDRKFVGLVSRGSLEGDCWGRGHDLDRCFNRNHVDRDVPVCSKNDLLSSDGAVSSSRKPVVVVDDDLRPLGFLMSGDLRGHEGTGPASAGDGRARRILVIDADRDARCHVLETLNAAGYEVRTAPDGGTGLSLACSWQPDLVLMELSLPDLNGWNACHLMARGMSTAGIPVVLVSEGCREEERRRIEEAGFVGFLRKPLEDADLLDMVSHGVVTGREPRRMTAS